MKDTYHDNKAVQAIAPAVVTANTNGTAIDLNGFDSALIIVNTGAIAGDGAYSVKLQESDVTTSNKFTDVDAADLLGSLPEVLEADKVYRIGYIGSKRKRYIRAVATKASGTSIALGVVAVLGHPSMAPVA